MQAAILSIGDELVLGQTIDTNSAYLSAQLVGLGIGTLFHMTVADDLPMIIEAIQIASKSVDLVIISGGLGPTDDDLTREALAQAMGRKLIRHEPTVAHLAGFFQKRGRAMPERNLVQALYPEGTEVIPNTCGTAPGIKAKFNKAVFYLTPGVPSEMKVMFNLSVLPELSAIPAQRNAILTSKINTFGLGESTVNEILGTLMDRKRNPIVGTTVANGFVSVRVRSEFPDRAFAQAQLDDTLAQAEKILGPTAFGREEETLQASVYKLLLDQKLTLATAESCTAGLIGKMITDVSGSSSVYAGGWITYANEMKSGQLNVPAAILQQHGAVSPQTARTMAQNALALAGSSLAISVTGVAGPSGGTEEKPVGLVYVGLAWKTQDAAHPVADKVIRLDLSGDRDAIRDRAAKSALQLLRFHLLDAPIEASTWWRPV